MNKFKNVLRTAALAGVLCAALSGNAFAADVSQTFITGTQINGILVGGDTVEEAQKTLAESYGGSYSLTITEKDGKTEKISGRDIDINTTAASEALQELLDRQNAAGRVFGESSPINTEMQLSSTYSQEKLAEKIAALECIANQTETADAHISEYIEGKGFEIVPEAYGNSLDEEKTKALIADAVARGEKNIDLNSAGVYDEVKITKDDENLKKRLDEMNKTVGMEITYKIRGNEEKLSGTTIVTWLTGEDENGLMGVDRNQAYAYVDGLKAKYDTAGTERQFNTATGKTVTLTGPYGWTIDREKETDAVIGMIRTGESQERIPEYSKKAASETGNDWGSTYVEVDLTGQHVYMIKDGAVVWDAPCVTGNVSKDYTTPAGIYSIYSKEKNRVLRGAKRADGTYEYESPVSFWMPFNGGIGLHDANWRGSFGGTIYKTSGSHGCVNLPPSKVPALYDLIYVGCPVICYNY